MTNEDQIVIYQTKDGNTQLDIQRLCGLHKNKWQLFLIRLEQL